MTSKDVSKWDKLEFSRRMETFGPDDMPAHARGPRGELDGICQPGELTDKGRETTLALGQRLRHLYVEQLNFLPSTLSSPNSIHLRASPIPRALESAQQAFYGLYPPQFQNPDLPTPVITARAVQDETIFPNEGGCKRYAQLAAAFANRAAERWNSSPEMAYLNRKLGKYMPETSPTVAVDGKPRLSGIMDSLNATLAHGPDTMLPAEFHDAQVRQVIDKIACDEWFDGYKESREYRMLGIGSLAAEMVARMCAAAAVGGRQQQLLQTSGDSLNSRTSALGSPQLWLAGAHDTTLAGMLASLGAFDDRWPPYTSHIAMELFRDEIATPPQTDAKPRGLPASSAASASASTPTSRRQPWFASLPLLSSLFRTTAATPPVNNHHPASNPAHTPTNSLDTSSKELLRTHYVRIRYNDAPVALPGCRARGRHLDEARGGDASFCTLEAFREIVEGFAPRDWRGQCRANLGREGVPVEGGEEWAGMPAAAAAEEVKGERAVGTVR